MTKIPQLHTAPSTLILRALRHPRYLTEPNNIIRSIGTLAKSYEFHVWHSYTAITALDGEVRYTLGLLARARSPVRLRTLVKQYIISWNTLSDICAAYLNEIFNLGIAEQDVSFWVVLRNKHVSSHPVAHIIKKNVKAIRHAELQRLRNDIVHRGRLRTPAVDRIEDMETSASLAFLFEPESAKETKAKIATAVAADTKATAQEFALHYASTVRMLNEVADATLQVIKSHLRIGNA